MEDMQSEVAVEAQSVPTASDDPLALELPLRAWTKHPQLAKVV
jgi:hypothetical protein